MTSQRGHFLTSVTGQEINTYAVGPKVIMHNLFGRFYIKFFATKHVYVTGAVQFHEMPCDVAGGYQLHQTVALFWIPGQQVLNDGFSMRGHVYPGHQIFDKTIDVVAVVYARATRTIQQ